MPTRWRIVDCANLDGSLRSTRGGVIIAPKDRELTSLPVADVAVFLVGPGVRFSCATIHRLLDADIAVIFCDWKGVPEGGAYSWCDHGRVGARHLAQTVLTAPRQKNAWAHIIRAKIQGQAETLRALGRQNASELSAWSKLVRSGDPSNLEGRAARLYWQSMWDDKSFRRTPGEPDIGSSTRNAQLDYGYTVLRGLGIRAVLAAGLSPTIGIFHHGRANNFSLVDDLIEPFRPAVDFGVARLPYDANMSLPETRKRLVQSANQTFTASGLTIGSALEDLAQQFGRYVEGEVARLQVDSWRGPV